MDALGPIPIVVADQCRQVLPQIPADQLEKLRRQARPRVAAAVDAAFQYFPVRRAPLVNRILDDVLTPQTICSALFPSEPEPANLSAEREKYRGGELSVRDAGKRGVVVSRVAVEKECPAGYDWNHPQHYNDVESCDTVLGVIGNDRLPLVVYAVETSVLETGAVLGNAWNAYLYNRYDDEGVKQCQTDDGKRAYLHDLTAANMGVTNIDVEMIVEPFNAPGFGAWNLRPSCTMSDDTKLTADDLLYAFGLRVYVDVDVALTPDQPPTRRTIVVGGVAANSANSAVRAVFSKETGLEHFLGGEYCRKLDLNLRARQKP